MTKSKDGHIEFRKNGEQKFYAPDRDLLYLAPLVIKSALAITCQICSEDVFENQLRPMIKDIARIYNDAVQTDKSGSAIMNDVITSIHEKPDSYKLFLEEFFTSFGLAYINAIRDAADKPVLTDSEFERALKAASILSKLPEEIRDKVEPYVKIAAGDGSSFCDGESAFTKVTK